MIYYRHLLTLLSLGVFGHTALAASGPYLSETDLLGNITQVESATRLKQDIRDLPAAVTVIDRRMIQASGAVNIADLLRLVPGFQAYHVNANAFGITSHGQGEDHNSRLELMIDSRSVYLPLLSSVDWSALGISIEDIDRIEVVRGPSVPSQGSNAFLGAINIITRSALQDLGTSIATTQGSLQTAEYNLRHNGQLGDFHYRLSANFHSNAGTGVGFEDGNPSNTASRMEDGGEISQLFLSSTYTPRLSDIYQFQMGLSHGQIGRGSATSPSEYNPRDVDSHFQDIRWTRRLNQDQSLSIHAYHNYHRWRETDLFFVDAGTAAFLGFSSPFVIDLGVEDGVTERYDVEITHQSRPWNNARLFNGAGVRWESLQSDALLKTNDTEELWLYRLFSNLEWKPNRRWSYNLGAMLESNRLVGARLSPRLAANYHLDPQQTLRAAVSRAYRTPSLLEQYQFAGIKLPDGRFFDVSAFTSGDLSPEKVTNYELGYLLRSPRINSSFDLKLFLEDAEEGINGVRVDRSGLFSIVDPDPSNLYSSDNQNSMDWKTRGWEVQWRLQPWHHSWFYLAYANTRASGIQPKGVDRKTENPADHNPEQTLALIASHRVASGLDASLSFYRMSDVEWLRGSVLDAYDRLDLRLAKQFQFGSSQGRLELIMQNLLSPYTEFEANNRFDTRTFVRIKMDFM